MSQQTPVSRVEGPWQEWMKRWPTPREFSQADSADVLRAWGSLGYPRRALRLLECAREIVSRHDGEVPANEAQLRELPGIGEYTAAAVANFGWGQRATVLDTNVRRVIARVFEGKAAAKPSLGAQERAFAASLVPASATDSVVWNEGIMELGALVCTARSPKCAPCPVTELCEWRKAGYPDQGAITTRPQRFEGTDRQFRGRMMRVLRENARASEEQLTAAAKIDTVHARLIIEALVADGLIHEDGARVFHLGSAPK